MDNFKRYNNAAGWVVFALSLIAYVLTAAPTADWWDCMEFTATSYKLEVGHPPGAPLFMMIMRLFTMLSFGHTEWVGFAANLMSCVASAFCVLFMFWTVTRLARKMYGGSDGQGFDAGNKTHVWTVIGAGAVGALAYAFSDTFWFSAVESEVYALSSMFTALVVWLMLRWEEVADEPHSTRWLILIAYMMGLSIGVHILNLLTVPALVLIYYFRKSARVTWKGGVLALAASLAILAVIYKMVMPWTVNIGAWFDRQFVNSLGLPVNSGLVTWVLLLLALVGAGVWVTHRKGKVLLNTVLLCVGVILIGYSSYASMVIRSSANPPMDSNNPDNGYALYDLLLRKQYGSQPILRGQSYSSPPIEYKYSDSWALGENGKYRRSEVPDVVFAPGSETLFPRMWDHTPGSVAGYEGWMGEIRKRTGTIPGYDGSYSVPTVGEHMRYFFTYQLNYMYWRYFMWNFVGRQDDVQGRGDIMHGNWLSGVEPIDALYLGPQTDLPGEVRRNPGRNRYFFLPFLLGVLGLIAQMGRDRRGVSIVAMLFVMMGLALVVYFNITPTPPRERDYIYAGSFYAFAIWIGLGVLWAQEVAVKLLRRGHASAIVAAAVCAAVPLLMAAQGWDDHDRSGRSMGNAYGHNALISTLPNSIIMNYGDNDTFPLWYNQEVENVRPDVRIMNMSYLGGEWYIEQMLNTYNASAPVPFSLPMSVYRANPRIDIHEVIDRPLPLRTVLDFVANPDPKTKMEYEDGTTADYIPTRKLILPVDKANALASGTVRAEDAHLMADSIEITLPERSIDITQLALLDLLGSFDWSRPLYFTTPLLVQELGLGDWLQTDGWVYRLVPVKTPSAASAANIGRIDTELTYDLLMNRYRYGGSGTPGVNIDWYSVANLRFVLHRHIFTRLANALIDAGDKERAVEVLDRSLAEYPSSKFNYDGQDFFPLTSVESYYAAGATERGDELLEDYANTLCEYVEYYLRFTGSKADAVYNTLMEKIKSLDTLALIAGQYGRTGQYEKIDSYLDSILGEESEGTGTETSPAADSTSAGVRDTLPAR